MRSAVEPVTQSTASKWCGQQEASGAASGRARGATSGEQDVSKGRVARLNAVPDVTDMLENVIWSLGVRVDPVHQ